MGIGVVEVGRCQPDDIVSAGSAEVLFTFCTVSLNEFDEQDIAGRSALPTPGGT